MAFKAKTSTPSEFRPIDDNQEWAEIFDRLADLIEPKHAYAWFGHCKFIRRQSDTLELSHWGAFCASESLRRHGMALCRAARVGTIRMNRAGGFRPVCLETQGNKPRQGYEMFRYADHIPKKRDMPKIAVPGQSRGATSGEAA